MKGLQNFGNTCYFNSVLQCILQVPQLSNYLIKTELDNSEFLLEYQKFVKKFWLDKTNSIEDHSKILNIFKTHYPQFNNMNQHDCQETLLFLFNLFEKDNKKLINKIFYFNLIQETICPSEKSKKGEKTNIHMLFPDKDKSTIEEIISINQKWNVLEGYIDSKNNKHNVASTRTLYWTCPKVLIFSIKMYDSKYRVTLPEILDINPYIHQDSPIKNKAKKYYLFAMCSHMGSTRGGHYVAYTKHREQWYLKDDTSCCKVDDINLCDYFYIVMYKAVE
jgi:ubiquitin C-terminal hydrolase